MENERILNHIIPEGQIEVWPDLGFEHPMLRPAPPIDPDNAECIDTRLFEVRSEIQAIQPNEGGVPTQPIVLEGIAPSEPTPIGILREKQVLRRQKEQKERAPKQYSEMLVVLNDLQLLRNADDEAVGAMMHYLEANGPKITHLVLNGDIVDMEQANTFGSTPDQAGTMADEIAAMRWFIDSMNRFMPNAKKVFVWGNHESRFNNYMANQTSGIEEWIKDPEEVFGLGSDWQTIKYGSGKFFQWHDRIFWHGHRAGSRSHIAKLELQDTGLVSVTTAHINRNQYHEERNALGRLSSGIVHGGFSRDNLSFMKKANTNWSQGFGVYFWDKKTGEQPYSVVMKHGTPAFIGPDGNLYDGTGYNLREEIGLEVKRGRGRPRKGQ